MHRGKLWHALVSAVPLAAPPCRGAHAKECETLSALLSGAKDLSHFALLALQSPPSVSRETHLPTDPPLPAISPYARTSTRRPFVRPLAAPHKSRLTTQWDEQISWQHEYDNICVHSFGGVLVFDHLGHSFTEAPGRGCCSLVGP